MARSATDSCIVVADNTNDSENIVITVYEPDPEEWEADFKRRKTS